MVQQKLFYNISELSEMFSIAESTIRFWEKNFPLLEPQRLNGVRKYREKDIDNLRLVYHLVKEKGLKIAAAKSYLKTKPTNEIYTNALIVEKLERVKSSLQQVLQYLDDPAQEQKEVTIVKFD